MSELIRAADEHWKDNLIGLTLDDRLNAAIAARRLKEVREEIPCGLTDFTHVASIDCKGRIRDIGFSPAGDLILDNFGQFLSGWFGYPGAYTSNIVVRTLYDTTNAARSVYVKGCASSSSTNWSYCSSSAGILFQMGSGSTAPARSDYNIQTNLGNAPENTTFLPADSSYASGLITEAGVVVAGGSGTVREAGVFMRVKAPSTLYNFMLFHDQVTPVTYVAGDRLTQTLSLGI